MNKSKEDKKLTQVKREEYKGDMYINVRVGFRRFTDLQQAAQWLVDIGRAKSVHSAMNQLNDVLLGKRPTTYGFRVTADKAPRNSLIVVSLDDNDFESVREAAIWLVEQGKAATLQSAVSGIRGAMAGRLKTAFGYKVRGF